MMFPLPQVLFQAKAAGERANQPSDVFNMLRTAGINFEGTEHECDAELQFSNLHAVCGDVWVGGHKEDP